MKSIIQKDPKRILNNSDLHEGNYKEFLQSRVRRVKWLFNNNNKMLEVVSQKDAWSIVSKMQTEIDELKERIKKMNLSKDSGQPKKPFQEWPNY